MSTSISTVPFCSRAQTFQFVLTSNTVTSHPFSKYDSVNPNTFAGLVRKKLSRRRKEGRVEKKKERSAPAGPGARTRDLPHAKRGSPAARQGGLFRQASLSMPIDR